MKIVVCDDSMVDLEKIRGLLTIYKERHKAIQLETEYFTDSAKLYRWIQAGAQGDIYILDMIMSQRTGIDIGALMSEVSLFISPPPMILRLRPMACAP